MKLCISFLVWEIHKPIAGDVGSNVGALQPRKMDNQCVEKIPLFVFCWMERRPPTVGRYPGAICGASARVAAKRLDCSRWADIQPQKKAAGATSRIDAARHTSEPLIVFGVNVYAYD